MKNLSRCITALAAIVILFLLPFSVFGQEVERHEIPLGHSIFKGPADAPITIFEFLDFQ